MTMQLSEDDNEKLDRLLDGILSAYKDRQISLFDAAHVFTAAAKQREGEVRGWLKPQTLQHWKEQHQRTPR